MKVKLIEVSHSYFKDVALPVEVEAYGVSGSEAGIVFIRGDEVIALGAKAGTEAAEYQDGIHPNYMIAVMIGQQVEDTDEVLEAFGLGRNVGTMEA